jgi:succinate dehydrogenase/fumarate reductase flavoprotein subunit
VAAADPVPDWFVTAPDLPSLARELGVPEHALTRTVAAMNDHADRGIDPEFGRGGNGHDTFNGDSTHGPNPCLGRIETPPFHALPITVGMNGTKGGLVTDARGAVLDAAGGVVPGLFACGETAAALMGPGYAGNGASLGPSLTTGLVIGESAEIPDRSSSA